MEFVPIWPVTGPSVDVLISNSSPANNRSRFIHFYLKRVLFAVL
jgi:hypothetical protein